MFGVVSCWFGDKKGGWEKMWAVWRCDDESRKDVFNGLDGLVVVISFFDWATLVTLGVLLTNTSAIWAGKGVVWFSTRSKLGRGVVWMISFEPPARWSHIKMLIWYDLQCAHLIKIWYMVDFCSSTFLFIHLKTFLCIMLEGQDIASYVAER